MDIDEAVTTEFLDHDPETPVSKLVGTFREHQATAIVIRDDDGVQGVVTRKQLLGSHHDPAKKARRLMRDDVPRVDRRDDVREVARLMVESELNLLPVYDGDVFEGVVTDESLTRAVEPFLDALDVADVYSRDLQWVGGDATIGEVINTLRTHDISRVPVVDDTDDPVGMISYFDLLEFIVRATDRQQGGSAGGFDGHGGAGSHDGYRTHTGWGDRAGDEARLLDLPARDVMNSPVAVTDPTTSLRDAVAEMLDDHYRSLVVVVPAGGPDGIVTLTDVLRSLTWTPDEETPLQVFGADLLSDISREGVAEMIQEIDGKYDDMDLIGAYVVLDDHKERQRGVPLVRATIRLFTNKGRFSASGEEYGAAAAIREARDLLERTVLDEKGRSLDERRSVGRDEELERLVGWWQTA